MFDNKLPIQVEFDLEKLLEDEGKKIQTLHEEVEYRHGYIEGLKVAQEVVDRLVCYYTRDYTDMIYNISKQKNQPTQKTEDISVVFENEDFKELGEQTLSDEELEWMNAAMGPHRKQENEE